MGITGHVSHTCSDHLSHSREEPLAPLCRQLEPAQREPSKELQPGRTPQPQGPQASVSGSCACPWPQHQNVGPSFTVQGLLLPGGPGCRHLCLKWSPWHLRWALAPKAKAPVLKSRLTFLCEVFVNHQLAMSQVVQHGPKIGGVSVD